MQKDYMQKEYKVFGMSCAACVARVEKALKKTPGVKDCTVNPLTQSASVSGNYSEGDIMQAVKKAGYRLQALGVHSDYKKDDFSITQKQDIIRLFFSVFFTVLLMYISMFSSMLCLPLPVCLKDNCIGQALTQLLLCVLVMTINQRFFVSGAKALLHLSPNMDSLVALGSFASFLYSTFVLFFATVNINTSKDFIAKYGLYFESASSILTLISVGKLLESFSKGKTTASIKSLLSLKPKTALLIKQDKKTTVLADSLDIGDIFAVKQGEAIPTDAIIINGEGSIDEATLTGEGIPVFKKTGDKVFCSTILQNGYIECKTLKTTQDTTFSNIIKLVQKATGSKAPIQKIADQVASVFVPVVIATAFLTFALWFLFSLDVAKSLTHAVCVLVISCPCSLGLATPVAIMVASGVAAKRGIFFCSATALQETGKVDIVALDKTGTLTTGTPEVIDIVPCASYTQKEILQIACSIEEKSSHPLATSIIKAANKQGLPPLLTTDFMTYTGQGIKANVNEKCFFCGSYDFIKENVVLSDSQKTKIKNISYDIAGVVFLATKDALQGYIVIKDTIKDDAKKALDGFKALGKKVIMLTGDSKKAACTVANKLGIDYIAEVLPEDKATQIEKLSKNGKVMMIGDGVNDAVALTKAHVGVAIGSGSEVAINSSGVVLLTPFLFGAVNAIIISKKCLATIKQGLFWAFFYNILGIPLAAGLFNVFGLGINLSPMFGAFCMSLSSFCVVTNALRLNLLSTKLDKLDKIKDTKDKANSTGTAIKQATKGDTMTKTLIIKGMMCHNCENHVKKALLAIDGIKEATLDAKAGSAVVTLTKDVSNDILKKAITDLDYELVDIK